MRCRYLFHNRECHAKRNRRLVEWPDSYLVINKNHLNSLCFNYNQIEMNAYRGSYTIQSFYFGCHRRIGKDKFEEVYVVRAGA
jgi:hypothetical protein